MSEDFVQPGQRHGTEREGMRADDVLNRVVDPATGKVYWRDKNGVLRPRVLTDADGRVVAQEQVGGFFPRNRP